MLRLELQYPTEAGVFCVCRCASSQRSARRNGTLFPLKYQIFQSLQQV